MMKKLFATPFGTALKVFISTVLTLWISTDNLFAFDIESIKKLLTAGCLSAVPVIINWANPNYTGYGINSTPSETSMGKKSEAE